MKRLASFIAVLLMFAAAPVDSRELTGLVLSPDSTPLVGVSVATNVRSAGTQTDSTGRFTLRVTSDISRVTFSSVGYRSVQFRLESLPKTIVLSPIYFRGEDMLITADRAEAGISSIAFENLSRSEIERDYVVGELPLLLKSTPNLHSYTDGGGDLGYSYMRIRGFDDKRIATYINGVPLNDPEDQATYFVDLPDFVSNVSDIQVQRGVGNSLYGDASFGGSVNIVTNSFSRPQRTLLTAGYGEYTSDGRSISDLYKQSIEYSTGLIDGRWNFGGRFSRQKSGGYRYNSWYEGWSYYFSVARLDHNMTTELHLYGGPIRMHLSYWGVPAEELKAGNRRFNPLTYSNETDNFNQPHYQLHNRYQISEDILLSNTVYYIRGKGFYEQLKELEEPGDWLEYNIDVTSLTDTIGNLVRQQWVEKNQFGWNPRLDINHQRGRHSFGGSYYYFESDHYGQVAWAQNITVPLEPRFRYYQYFGTKHVGSVFAEERYQFTDQLTGQVTAQLRYQHYRFDQVKLGAFAGYDYSLDWLFFSPRVGLSYRPDRSWNLYANFAIASRTPTDAAIYDANDPGILPSLEIIDTILTSSGDTVIQFGEPTASDERVYNLELGAEFRSSRYTGTLNLFWMDFHNEIIPYGGLNPNTGLPITINAERSVHAGVELTFAAKTAQTITLSGNISWSYNRVKEFSTLVDGFPVDFADKRIAGFPDYLGNLIVDFDSSPFRATYRLRLAGRQYLELFNIEELAIDPYLVSSVTLGYTIDDFLQTGRVTFTGSIRNLWDKKYETSGYGGNFAYQVGSDTVVDGWAEYYPAAERSYFVQMKLELF